MPRLVRLLLLACLIVAAPAALAQDGAIHAPEAIERSISQPHTPLAPMWVEMDVCGSGQVQGSVFLNSLADYRDRGSLNIEIPEAVRASTETAHGTDFTSAFLGHKIRVYGSVRQVRIWLYRDGQRTGRYYFQTQMRLEDISHLVVLHRDGVAARADCGALMS